MSDNKEAKPTIHQDDQAADEMQIQGSRGWKFRTYRGLNWQYTMLMIVLLIFTALIPLEPILSLGWLDVAFAVVILAAVLIGGIHRRWVLVGLILVVPPLLLAIIADFDDDAPLIAFNIYFVILSLFIIIAIVSILQDIFKGHLITIHSISGAISVYILIALMWAIGFTLVEMNWPGSFDTPISASWQDITASTTEILATLFFFSVVTITTAGYGDVTPISPYARSLTSLELIVGQIFLAVLVAWLVGMYIARSIEPSDNVEKEDDQ